jgi:hypothetical protein
MRCCGQILYYKVMELRLWEDEVHIRTWHEMFDIRIGMNKPEVELDGAIMSQWNLQGFYFLSKISKTLSCPSLLRRRSPLLSKSLFNFGSHSAPLAMEFIHPPLPSSPHYVPQPQLNCYSRKPPISLYIYTLTVELRWGRHCLFILCLTKMYDMALRMNKALQSYSGG